MKAYLFGGVFPDKREVERRSAVGVGHILAAGALAVVLDACVRARLFDFFDMNHPAVVCNDYTLFHLPKKPVVDSREDANVASLAARIALSSFAIRSTFR